MGRGPDIVRALRQFRAQNIRRRRWHVTDDYMRGQRERSVKHQHGPHGAAQDAAGGKDAHSDGAEQFGPEELPDRTRASSRPLPPHNEARLKCAGSSIGAHESASKPENCEGRNVGASFAGSAIGAEF